MPLKPLLNAVHDFARWIAHACLVPVIATLKGADALMQHLIAELSKI